MSVIGYTKLLILNGLSIVIGTVGKWLYKDVKVTSATPLNTKHFVFNLSVENHNEYIANGLLSHNTDPLRYCCTRIHDIFPHFQVGGNIMPKEDENKQKNSKEQNFNDPYLFKDRRPAHDMSWATGGADLAEVA